MRRDPESVINMSGGCRHAMFCLDGPTHSVLTVIRTGQRVQSWWSGRDSLPQMIARYRDDGLSETDEVPTELRTVIDRRWPEVETLRGNRE